MKPYIQIIYCLLVYASLTNCLKHIQDSEPLYEALNDEPENIDTFSREERSKSFPRVGRSYVSNANRLRRILMNNPTLLIGEPKRSVRLMRY
uniref:Uncharacterized protein n=1 Tax=Trichobilharzia regenti TaxID=157069 RepID=A0AA85IT19_TRIRE|nr:unnamed protein product [Trichobilharzia regenti]